MLLYKITNGGGLYVHGVYRALTTRGERYLSWVTEANADRCMKVPAKTVNDVLRDISKLTNELLIAEEIT